MSRTAARRSRSSTRLLSSAAIAPRALAWFERNARELPWRSNKSRYRVWVSEIMLQQTQVATVVPYFERFVAQFPNVRALAAADESVVLRAWEGLGYYRRARQLHQAARQIVEQHNGKCPAELDAWQALPGIGRYTAGAILSISDDARLPILEANTIRLYCRLTGERGDPGATATRQKLWRFAESLLPDRRAGDFNQALMEIGSLLCTPRVPRCDECPLRTVCVAYRQGTTELVPRKSAAPKLTEVRQVAIAVQRGDRILMRKSAPGERWAGLWDLARYDLDTNDSRTTLSNRLRKDTGLVVNVGRQAFAFRFGVTRYSIDLRCHVATKVAGRLKPKDESVWQWLSIAELEQYPLNVTARRIIRRLELRREHSHPARKRARLSVVRR